MNEHITRKERSMAMTTEEAVAKGAELFANAEDSLTALVSALPKILATARDAGLLGGIECIRLTADACGDVNEALFIIAGLHERLTAEAQGKGVDVPAPRSGGGR
jgi:hypothetical protein